MHGVTQALWVLFACSWYHKKGEEWDICPSEYEKLNSSEKRAYVKIDSPDVRNCGVFTSLSTLERRPL
eukprot:SAG11_NODE_921_length_6541_cov_9.172462_5_plen_68_part_00